MKEIKVGNIVLKNTVAVGPMAGVSDVAFRSMIAQFKPGLVYSEMISSKGIVHNNKRTHEMCQIADIEGPVALQLFGNQVDEMVKAAIHLDQNTKCSIIDINMGCPVHKVVKGNGGASLMKNPELAIEIVTEIVKNVKKPVSVKMRTGWDDNTINCVELAQAFERAGVALIAIHGRTRVQMYSGDVNHELIRAVKQAVSIPVIGNGNIRDVDSARKMTLDTGVDGIMIARSALTDPWFIKTLVSGEHEVDSKSHQHLEVRLNWLRQYFIELIRYTDENIAVRKMRGLAAQYISGFEDGRKLKGLFIRMKSFEEFDKIITEYKLEKSEKYES